MIETVMLVALGFTVGSLLALLIAPAVWRRAVRLTRREIEATMPISVTDIKADKDLLRAESAVEMRRLELALEKAKQRAARHLMERNQHMVEMGKLESEIAELNNSVAERTKAGSVMEQTVQQRIPDLEAQLAEAMRIISTREQELADRARAFENQTESLELAQGMIRRQEQEIDRLRAALEGGGTGSGLLPWRKGESEDGEHADLVKQNGELNAELSRLREHLAQLKEVNAADTAALRTEMQRLADLMLSGAKSSAAKSQPRQPKAEEAEKEPKSEAPEKTDDEKAARDATPKPAAMKKASRSGNERKTLSERLSGLKRNRVKENA